MSAKPLFSGGVWVLRLMRTKLKDIEIKGICAYEEDGRLFIEVELRPVA